MSGSVAFIGNKYYGDVGMDYVFVRLRDEFALRGISLVRADGFYASFPPDSHGCECAVFWDKDVALAYNLQSVGVRLFNGARTIELCDDKQKTFAALCGKVDLPATVVAPLVYDVSDGEDPRFCDFVESTVGYPAVVKECVGSQGRQVYLAHDRVELENLRRRLAHIPHIYQRFVNADEAGSDTRVYIVGGKAVGAARRKNTTDFRSNAALGGSMTRIFPSAELVNIAEKVADVLRLEYGSADFMEEGGQYVFIEANSSPYMKNAEALGIPLSRLLVDYIVEVTHATER